MVDAPELRDAGRLAGDALAGAVRSIRHVHLAISSRTFAAVGPVGAPIRTVHDGITRGVYATVAAGHALAPRVGALGVAVAGHSSGGSGAADHDDGGVVGGNALDAVPTAELGSGIPLDAGPADASASGNRRDFALGVLNGLKGDVLAADYPELAFATTLRTHPDATTVGGGRSYGRDVDPTPDGLASAYPDASPRIAMFVHGLCETDRWWWNGATRHHGEPFVSYGSLLADDLGYTPVYLRYNSGLPIDDNGRALADLLHTVVDAWPVQVEELVFIGHSMGGLVVRSACHRADLDEHHWVDRVRRVICVGTPHFGAPLERAVEWLVPVLERLPETQPLAAFLDERSAGVKDLRHGVFVADEYHGDDPDEYLAHRRREVPFRAGITYCFVGATITRDRHHPLGVLVGDLLVTYPSASGRNRHRSIPFELEHGAHVGGINHFDLLNHPEVYEHLRRWLADDIEPSPTS